MTTKTRLASALAVLSLSAVAAILSAGCESSDDSSGSYWTTESHTAAKPAATSSSSSSSSGTTSSSSSKTSSSSSGSKSSSSSESKSSSSGASSTPGTAAAQTGAADEVPFSALRWVYGGKNGSHASKTSASIGHLRASGSSMTYRWTGPTLRSWGLSDSNPGAMACFFVQRSNGSWVGGKFDWISTSRTSRGFENILGGYGGWSLSGVPNPCPCAFVIVSADCKKRTNVIGGVWRR